MAINKKTVDQLFDMLDTIKYVCKHKSREAYFNFPRSIVKETICNHSDIPCDKDQSE